MKKPLGILVAASAMGFVMSGATSQPAYAEVAAGRFPLTSEQIKAKAEGRCLNPSCTAISQKKPETLNEAVARKVREEEEAKAAKAAIAQKNKEMTDRADAQRRTAELARAKSEEKRRAQVKWGACMANKFPDCGPKPEL